MKIESLIPYSKIEDIEYSGESTFTIKKEDFTNTQFQDNKITFSFIGCKFEKIIIENRDIIDFPNISIDFISCFISEIEIDTIETENISILFYSSIISGGIKSNKINSITINNSIVKNSLFLLNQKAINISLTEENIFPIRWGKLLKSIGIKHMNDLLTIKQSYYIHDSKIITFSSREVSDKKPGYFKRNSNNMDDYCFGYYLTKAQKSILNLNLNIIYSQEIDKSETKIIDSFFNSFSISGYLNGKLNIDNTKIENWFIRGFSVQNEATFYNISPINLKTNDSKIEIHKSNLDNTWFDDTDFSQYKTVSFYRTKFGKTTFTSCNFPEDYTSFEKFKSLENVHYPEKIHDNYYKNQYEIFLQLKKILELNGNFYESQKLQAISNDALKKINHISNWDKTILWINSKSNNHGLSISLPLKYFIMFSIFFYILYLLSLGRIFNSNKIDSSLIGYYFSFIDVTHRADFLVKKEEFNIGSLTIDFLNKLFLGFFIYQFISAFRKYGKK
ncbi:MAG: hypothetical protein ABI793_07420 [Flavobacterium sp.]